MNRTVRRSAIAGFFSLAVFCSAVADDAPQPVYGYNDQGQMILATYPNGAALAYTYDNNGIIATVVQVASPPPPQDDDYGN